MDRGSLLAVLERARDRGFLGAGEVERHLDHSLGFADVARTVLGAPPARFADLGSGGGVPALVLAAAWPDTRAVLVESSVRRAGWLRAEAAAHLPDYREAFGLVTARSFAPPPVTAEIGAGFVAIGGIVLVSEPPAAAHRWPEEPLGQLGLDPAQFSTSGGAHYVWMRKAAPTPPDRPRKRARAMKRPLW